MARNADAKDNVDTIAITTTQPFICPKIDETTRARLAVTANLKDQDKDDEDNDNVDSTVMMI